MKRVVVMYGFGMRLLSRVSLPTLHVGVSE